MKKMTVEQIVEALDEIMEKDCALERFAEEIVEYDDLYRDDKEEAFAKWAKEDFDFLNNLKKHIRIHELRYDYYCGEDIEDIAEKLGTECSDEDLAYDFESLWNEGEWNKEVRDISILMEDHRTYKEAVEILKSGKCDIYDDFEENLEKYLTEWLVPIDADTEDDDYKEFCANIRKMIATKNPIDCWGIVERKGKNYYIEYCL